MAFKKFLGIFLSGALFGLLLSPLSKYPARKAIVSPVSPGYSAVNTNQPQNPARHTSKALQAGQEVRRPEGQVKGLETHPANPRKSPSVNSPKISNKPQKTFGEIIKASKDAQNEESLPSQEASPPKDETSSFSGSKTILAFGDSMIQTMGEGLPYLKESLSQKYPQAQFNLINLGIGSTNILQGLDRVNEISQHNPDIVILGSYAYNPLTYPDRLNDHWLTLGEMVKRIKSFSSAKIIILAEVAPSISNFGDGPNGVNWPEQMSQNHAQAIKAYLQNTTQFAQGENLPLANVFHQTLQSNGEGMEKYINPGDHIHASVAGHQLTAQTIANTIFNHHLF